MSDPSFPSTISVGTVLDMPYQAFRNLGLSQYALNCLSNTCAIRTARGSDEFIRVHFRALSG
jgi:hypothetical protein